MAKHRTGYLFKRGSNFYCRWKVEGKVFVQALRDDEGIAIANKRDAEEAKAKIMAPFTVANEVAALEAIAGKLEGRKAELARLENENNPPLTIKSAWAAFLASPSRPDSGQATLYQYACQWNAFEGWLTEKHPSIITLRDVTRCIAEEYAGTLNHGKFSPNTYNKHLNVLTLVFRVAKQKARLTENPWEDIQRKKLITHSRRELTIDELRKVCQSAAGEMRVLLALGVYTGLRLGDCSTLRWCEVDLSRNLIRRVPNKTARSNPKSVIVPIHPVLLSMLAEMPEDKRAEYVLPEYADFYNRERCDSITDRIQAHFTRCGIRIHKAGTGDKGKRAVIEVGFHSLRHSFVSLCREANAPLSVVESIVGHSNPSMTRHYTHVGELAAGKAVAALPSITGESKREPKPDTMSEARAMIESITAKNWREKKTALLDLLTAADAAS